MVLLNKVYRRKKQLPKMDVHAEAAALVSTHGRKDGTFSLMEWMDVIEALDEADGKPTKSRSEVMSLFSDAKEAHGEPVGQAALVRLLTTVYERKDVRQLL